MCTLSTIIIPVATITPEKRRSKRVLNLAMKKRKEAESDAKSLELESAEGGRWDSFFVVKMCHFIVVWYNIIYIVHIYYIYIILALENG